MSRRNVVDSSGWLEYLSDGRNATFFESPLRDPAALVVPVVSIYEVFKVVFRQRGENDALQVVAAMQKGQVVDVTSSLALAASRLSLEHHLPMADSLILATAQAFNAVLWTQDADFRDMPGVKYVAIAD
jgi:predicted nucleic acid-binding protein